MNKIIFPLIFGNERDEVGDLQDALQLLLDKKMFLQGACNKPARDEINRLRSTKDWKNECDKNCFCGITKKFVTFFQNDQGITPVSPVKIGEVDKKTADAINNLLTELESLNQPDVKYPYIMYGSVHYDNNLPLKGTLVKLFHILDQGKILLGEDITDADGHYTIRYEPLPKTANDNLQLIAYKDDGTPLKSLKSDGIIRSVYRADIVVARREVEIYQVIGKVNRLGSASLSGLRVLIMDKDVGGDTKLAEVTTDENGAYQATFTGKGLQERCKERPDIQVRVLACEKILGSSEVRYNASNRETINVLLDEEEAPALLSEHETLTNAISTHFKGKLNALKETDEQEDITYLANKTGWDARAVALAALADTFSEKSKEKLSHGAESTIIDPPFFYALFRAGIPANENALYQVDPLTAKDIWKQSISQGMISAELEKKLTSTVDAFKKLEANEILKMPPSVGVSTLGKILSVSLGDKEELHLEFAGHYTEYRNNPSKLWEEVKNNPKLGEKAADQLKLDGKLAYLTLNNAPLISKLHALDCWGEKKDIKDPLNLVEAGYYHAEKWEALVTNCPVPEEIPGKDDSEKRSQYPEILASMIRISYPTAVVAQMVKNGETPLTGIGEEPPTNDLIDSVYSFLFEHHGKFEIGMQPVEQYIAQNKLQTKPEVVKEITRIQRVYQITPSHDAMNNLLKNGVDSAYAVINYDRDEFVRAFEKDVGGEINARLIYEKSQQVHNIMLNIAISYLTSKIAPGIGVHSPPNIIKPVPNPYTSDVIAYSTLESLFGEMDYCACEHCRSILSPAAYLVDLLKFIDLKPCMAIEPDSDYENGEYQEESPLCVLLDRRPEIQYIPLTCENTNIPLPYIDLVNETLEYYITNNFSLNNYIGHNTTDEATAEELMASPMFVRDEAYDILNRAFFPPALPFHQPLESLRRYFNKFEVHLPELMEKLRKDDNLEIGTSSDYGWRDILMEELNLSRSEYLLLTKSERTNEKTNVELTVKKLYGCEEKANLDEILYGSNVPNQSRVPGLSNAKVFTRRVGISYEDIVEILKTNFVNPNSALIPKLEKLGYKILIPKIERLKISFKTIQDFFEGKISDDQFEAMLPSDIDKSQYGNNIPQWVRENFFQIEKYIGVNFQTIKDFVKGDENGNLLPESAFRALIHIEEIDITQFGGKVELSDKEKFSIIEDWIRKNYEKIMGLILLTDPTKSENVCSFEKLEMQYSNPDNNAKKVKALEFVRLIRFIRLWKKLGWTIEQTDKAITALYPPDKIPDNTDESVNLQKLDEGFPILLSRLGVLKQVMRTVKLKPNEDLLPLLACFSQIDTHGIGSLYRQMFLSPSILRHDDVFADKGYGQFLTDNTQKLIAHAEVIRGAFNLTDEEFLSIFDDLGFHAKSEVHYKHTSDKLEQSILTAAPGIGYDNTKEKLSYNGVLSIETYNALRKVSGVSDDFKRAVDELYAKNQETLTPLTLDNISAIFRRGWLARKLNLSILELIKITKFAGIDPFASPDPVNPPILRLLELINRLHDASLKPTQALYLIWNQDISGKSAPDDSEITGFARTLRSDLSVIESEFALVNDPTGQITRARMSLVYGNEATDFFFGLLGNTLITSVEYNHEQVPLKVCVKYKRDKIDLVTNVPYDHGKANLEQPILDVALGLIAYNDQLKLLSFNGSLTEQITNLLKTVATNILSSQQAIKNFTEAVDKLYVENQKVVKANLEQSIVNVVPGRITYNNDKEELSFEGVLTEATREILKTAAKTTLSPQQVIDDFIAATDKLYEENQKVIKANLQQSIIVDIEPGRIIYDDFRKLLSYSGLMTQEIRDKLKKNAKETFCPAEKLVYEEFKAAVKRLYNENQNRIKPFFIRYPELETLYDNYVASTGTTEKKFSDLLANILPELKYKRKKQQALQSISTALKADIEFASTILDNKLNNKYVLHGADTTCPAVDDLLALERCDLSEEFFFSSTIIGKPKVTRPHEANLAYNANNKLPANLDQENPKLYKPISGKWSGYLEAPESGFYKFQIEADDGAIAKLNLNGKEVLLEKTEVPLEKKYSVWRNKEIIELQAGTFYAITIIVENVKEMLNILWETTGRVRETIPSLYLYSEAQIKNLTQVYVRFLKSVSLATALKLTAIETAYFASLKEYEIAGQGWLNSLPVTESPDSTISTALLKAFYSLLDFASLKEKISPKDERLLSILKNPIEATQKPDSLLFTLVRWEPSSLDSLLTRFGKVKNGKADYETLKDLKTFYRIYAAYELVKKMGISAPALLKVVTNDPTGNTLRDLQASLRARYDRNDWLNVLKPINDEMRRLQRDSLVAYILHQMSKKKESEHIDTPEKLFEYFLMDVEMEPCMQTSRIRHALSSVQLFIERCLMNLEPRVNPRSIKADQWKWMSRYRIWEANRKVFLYPENWLEPELRDDQSPFFKEAMSELLQSDITEEKAAVAMLNYLSKLQEVALLEPCGIYFNEYKPSEPEKTKNDIAHVVVRTEGANRKYYYRRYEDKDSTWTPWEHIKLDIEDNPVTPVIWKERMFLFWLRILKEAPMDLSLDKVSNEGLTEQTTECFNVNESDCPTKKPRESELAYQKVTDIKKNALTDAQKNVKITVKAILCWSEYYNGKWQPTKTTDLSNPAILGEFDVTGPVPFDRSAMRLNVVINKETLVIRISGQENLPYFTFYNTHSLPVGPNYDEKEEPARSLEISNNILTTVYTQLNSNGGLKSSIEMPLLKNNQFNAHIIDPKHPLESPWTAPFLYKDNNHAFYVTIEGGIVKVPGWELPQIEPKKPPKPRIGKNTIAPPVVKQGDPRRDRHVISGHQELISRRAGFGIDNPALMEEYVSKDTNISRGLGTDGTINFDGRDIGPSGSLINRIKKR